MSRLNFSKNCKIAGVYVDSCTCVDELVEVVTAELVLDDGDQVLHQLHALPHAQAEAPVVQSLEVELQGHLVMCSPGKLLDWYI